MNNRYAIIIAGGKGERFWPQSRLKKPKHLLSIVGDKPILAQTLERLNGFIAQDHIFIITNKDQVDPIRELLQDLPQKNIIAEPSGRDTLPAIGLAMVLVKNQNPKACFCILPADHYIENHEAFRQTLDEAFQLAQATNNIVTLGVQPTFPATAYGYIKQGKAYTNTSVSHRVYAVDAFKEKPDRETAQQYLASKNYYWNAGCFVFSVPTLEAAFIQHKPKMKAVLDNLFSDIQANKPLNAVLESHYPELEKYLSIMPSWKRLTISSLLKPPLTGMMWGPGMH